MSRSTADSASAVTLPTPKERRRLREALALSEEQVAEAMGVTKATVRAWETGRSTPRGRKREAYAKLLGTDGPEGSDERSPAPPQAQGQSQAQAQAQAQGQSQAPSHAQTYPHPHAQTPSFLKPPARVQAAESAGVRPKATAKRAGRPPKAPSPAPAITSGPARKGAPKPQERLKPVPADAAAPTPAPAPAPAPAPSEAPSLTPEQAFDALYAHAAPGLVHQTYLLTGRRRLSREAVEYAFQHAWRHWPEVAVDPDPVGWVRATAYEYALSPWHRLRRAHKHPDAPPTEANRRALLSALLELPPPYRRTVLLYDGLGLDLPETAAETEASTPAAANRLLHARTVLGRRIPELAEPEVLHRRLGALVSEAPTATLPAARTVRTGSDRLIRTWTRAVLGVTAVLIGVTGFTAATAPTRYIPVNAPGETVNGVPVRGGPQKLRPEDVELREKLRSQPNPGPERLLPAAE
ncbi:MULTISPECIES: helix-turn-helix domain-containing protein [unclassified Streptomyces]|uniref:helix-turn-helix domain-containing protein n=1 Tax=unclassified Streptomyces TaxID=2593676 RepID=UPI0006F882D3|nr:MULTISPECIES: helix-turn-helix domain-containing protein [unclassified Streptomyces]KQX59081.1 XRE family transcriptional regulator [Streptomyces sp. Root1304]KRB00343.1 XRE family transcriptional regulator [Streptomyces sp. Root66D1]